MKQPVTELSCPCSRREHLNVVFIGHIDAGKSTLAGQILFTTVRAGCLMCVRCPPFCKLLYEQNVRKITQYMCTRKFRKGGCTNYNFSLDSHVRLSISGCSKPK
jgi:hypothetical protein